MRCQCRRSSEDTPEGSPCPDSHIRPVNVVVRRAEMTGVPGSGWNRNCCRSLIEAALASDRESRQWDLPARYSGEAERMRLLTERKAELL